MSEGYEPKPYNAKISGSATISSGSIAVVRNEYIQIGNVVELFISFQVTANITAGEQTLFSGIPELAMGNYIVFSGYNTSRTSTNPIQRLSLRGANVNNFYQAIPTGYYEFHIVYLTK